MSTLWYAQFDGKDHLVTVKSEELSNTLNGTQTCVLTLQLRGPDTVEQRIFDTVDPNNPRHQLVRIVPKFAGEDQPDPEWAFLLYTAEVPDGLTDVPEVKVTGTAAAWRRATTAVLPDQPQVLDVDLNPEAPVAGDIPRLLREESMQFEVYAADPDHPGQWTPVANMGLYTWKFRRWCLTRGKKVKFNPARHPINGIDIVNLANIRTQTSLKTPWKVKRALSYGYGSKLVDMWTDQAEKGALEFRVGGDRVWLCNPGEIGRDLTDTAAPVEFGIGYGTEMPIRISLEEMYSRVYAKGGDNKFAVAQWSDKELDDKGYDYHSEYVLDLPQVTRQPVLKEAAEYALRQFRKPGIELTLRYVVDGDRLAPRTGYDIGDWVWVSYFGKRVKLRVKEWTLSQGEGAPVVTVTLGRRFVTRELETWRRLKAIAMGDPAPQYKDKNYDPTTGVGTPEYATGKFGVRKNNYVRTWVGHPVSGHEEWKPAQGGGGGTGADVVPFEVSSTSSAAPNSIVVDIGTHPWVGFSTKALGSGAGYQIEVSDDQTSWEDFTDGGGSLNMWTQSGTRLVPFSFIRITVRGLALTGLASG